MYVEIRIVAPAGVPSINWMTCVWIAARLPGSAGSALCGSLNTTLSSRGAAAAFRIVPAPTSNPPTTAMHDFLVCVIATISPSWESARREQVQATDPTAVQIGCTAVRLRRDDPDRDRPRGLEPA